MASRPADPAGPNLTHRTPSYAVPVPTIEDLEGDRWPDPGPGATYLVGRCTALRRKPLAEFTVEDMRIMIGQRIGVSALLPRAVQTLVADPLAEGDYYPGDLLRAVLGLPEAAWAAFGPERRRLVDALQTAGWDGIDLEIVSAVRRFVHGRSDTGTAGW